MPSATPPDHHDTIPPPPVPERRSAEWWVRKAISLGLSLVVGVALIAALGLTQRMGWISAGGSGGAVIAEAGDQIYTCPMHPQIRQPSPGRCPICGMELVPSQSGGEQLDELAVRIEPAQRRLAQIETANVQRAPIVSEIRSIGSIAIDESRMATISSYIAGRIEQLFADYTGVEVAEGDHLAIVYSPELYERQVQYVEARRAFAELSDNALPVVRETQQKLVENTRQRLVELGMTEEQLLDLEETEQAQSRLTIHALFGTNHGSPEEDADIQIGTVIEKLAVEGDYIDAGDPIYRIADLSTVWLMLELFPEDAARIRFGQRVTANIQSLPGEEFTGRVAFIDRTVDTQRRTVGVRVEFLNDEGRLRPGDYATAMIEVPIGEQGEVYDADLAGKWISPMHPQIITDEPGQCPICGMDLVPTSRYGYSDNPVPQPESLFVPRSAVLMAGNNSVVYRETEPGRFEIRVVTLGPILRDRVVILDGLEVGDKVATAGNFLIDSQM
ncbi:MAG: efflux RND transporter periplasmic adaptor subunit, partial [Thermomicrobiales bacterium]